MSKNIFAQILSLLKVSFRLFIVFGILTIVAWLALVGPATATPFQLSNTVATAAQPGSILSTPTPGCLRSWEIIPSPNGQYDGNFLDDVAVISANDIWTVGSYKVNSQGLYQTLTIHWDGNAWGIVSSPNVAGGNNFLQGITAISPNDIWAVGLGGGYSLTMHWDGTMWSLIPNPQLYGSTLLAVAAVSSNDVWAVGSHSYPDSQTLTMHWNGSDWQVVPSPSQSQHNILRAVVALASNDVWAIGGYGPSTVYYTLTLHWDGQQWSTVSSPSVDTGTLIRGAAASSPNDIWAVGYDYFSGSPNQSFIMHWDGSTWSIIPSGKEGNLRLTDIVAISPNDAWAVGYYTIENLSRTLTMHWDGSRWTTVPSPSPAFLSNSLIGVAADPLGSIWAVGGYAPSRYETLIMRYPALPASCPSATPFPTSTPATATPTATPISCAPGPQTILREEFETGTLGAFTSSAQPPQAPGWSAVTDFANSGTYSAFAPDIDDTAWQYLTLRRPLPIPAGITRATLTFWHRYSFELPNYDCGHMALSPDAGATWLFPGPYFVSGGYNLTCNHDMFYQPGWGGNTQGQFIPVQMNLTAFAGQNLIFRFAEATDNSVAAEGWWIDDIKLTIEWPCPAGTTTPSPTVTASSTVSLTPTNTPVVTPTVTPVTPSPTGTSPPVITHTPSAISSPTATSLPTSTPTVTGTPTACPMQFTDVPPDSTFYTFIRCLACRGILAGYPCGGEGEPCDEQNNPYFRPNTDVTRGQIAKIVSNSAGFDEDPGEQIYEDVLVSNPFYQWINRLSMRGHMSGYPCGGEGEPCVAPEKRPYFRPFANATRGQLAKIVSNAAGYDDTPPGQTFADVLPTHAFYLWIERLASRNIMGGYPCGGEGEPCDGENRPYFRPFSNVTRGQTSKIVAGAFFPGSCAPRNSGQTR